MLLSWIYLHLALGQERAQTKVNLIWGLDKVFTSIFMLLDFSVVVGVAIAMKREKRISANGTAVG